SMGSVAGTVKQTVDYLNHQGRKVGFLNIHLYRPFPSENFLEKLPKTVTSLAVLDRTKEAGSNAEPLLLDIKDLLFEQNISVIGGRYGIGGKDTRPEHIVAVFEQLKNKSVKKSFTIGIDDDQTHLSLPLAGDLDLTSMDTYQAKFWGFGSDGTVGANKATIKIIGDHTDKYVQGAFEYDSKKSGGLTVSHLRFGDSPIQSEYMISHPNFVACHNTTYVRQYDLTKGLRPGGIFLLNTSWTDEQLDRNLPAQLKKYIAENAIRFYTIDAAKIAHTTGLGRRINTIMQVAFFKLTDIMPFDKVYEILKADAQKYARKSPKIVEQNLQAMEAALDHLHEVKVPGSWIETKEKVITAAPADTARKRYVFNFLDKVNAFEGDQLTVQDVATNVAAGSSPLGISAFEKRGIALEVPEWNGAACTQCNECSFVCPHAA
ncbi:MAG: 2-oxoacid:acceptor oxidoreductase family protein, partial [Lactococcus garvieae]